MTRLHRLPGKMVGKPTGAKRVSMDRVAPALQRVASNYMNPLTTEELAKACHMSLTHFRRIFRQAVGRSPLQYLNHLRIQMAASLLAGTDRTVLDISLAVGYETLSTFNRNFKAIMGTSPREWRHTDLQR